VSEPYRWETGHATTPTCAHPGPAFERRADQPCPPLEALDSEHFMGVADRESRRRGTGDEVNAIAFGDHC